MRTLFGDLCSGHNFRHDQEMRESYPEPYEDETQKSRNTCYINGSQTSSEDGDDQNDISDGEDEILSQVQWASPVTGSTAIDVSLSKDMYGDDCREQSTPIEAGITSTHFKAHSDFSDSIPVQHARLPAKSDAQRLRRRSNREDDNRSSRKRARRQEEQSDLTPKIHSGELETPESREPSQSAVTGVPVVSYYDTHDGVYRCGACGREFWRPEGVCTGCSAGEPAYYEVINSTHYEESNEEAKPKPKSRNHTRYPRIYLSSNGADDGGATGVKAEERTDATGYYLDGASAYDSASSSAENEYETNSFIDDSSVKAGIDEHTDFSASDDIDYKARYEELASAYSNVQPEHKDVIDDHEAFRRDVLRSDYNSSEDPDEPEFDVVNVEVQDPPISEMVFSHIQGDSQSSAMSASRLRTRVDAFLAAPEGWHNVSLMSTGDNHTEESQEL